jgi:hypothetical protein
MCPSAAEPRQALDPRAAGLLCAAALLANEKLEALPVKAEDRLDIEGDVLSQN